MYTHTRNISYVTQDEIYDACFNCMVIDTMKNDEVETTAVFDGIKKVEVIFNTTLEMLCTYINFQRKGIFSKYAIIMNNDKNVCEIPRIYILIQWTKVSLKKSLYDIHANLLDEV